MTDAATDAATTGTFVWHEIVTPDPVAAGRFYAAVLGWSLADQDVAGLRYTVASADGTPVAGLMALPEGERAADAAPPRPAWVGSVAVADVDLAAAQVAQLGGRVERPAADIPGVGRFAVVSDPQGAHLVLLRFAKAVPVLPLPHTAPGHVGWNELHAGDWITAFPFYATLFGWRKERALPMGPAGTYQLFGTDAGTVGAMMTAMEGTPSKGWLYYFNVVGIEAGVARVRDNGGTLLRGPHEVPGGTWIAHCADPQGGLFALATTPG